MAKCSKCLRTICSCQLENGLCPTCIAALPKLPPIPPPSPTTNVPEQQPKQELPIPISTGIDTREFSSFLN